MKNKSLTLMELIVAMALFAIIVMGAGVFTGSSTFFLKVSEKKIKVINELTLVLDYLHKATVMPYGNSSRFRLTEASNSAAQVHLRILHDTANTPIDFTDDYIVDYMFDFSGNKFDIRYPSGNWETISTGLVNSAAYPTTIITTNTSLSENYFQIKNLTFRYDPTSAADVQTNPEITIPEVFIKPCFTPVE